MLYYPFKDYAEFRELFGLREHGNGAKSRRNSILLAYYKKREILKEGMHDSRLLSITSMEQLKGNSLNTLCSTSSGLSMMSLNGRRWFNELYRTDHMKGKTEDGDIRSIRYARADTGKVYKMKAGKMYRHLITSSPFGKMLPEQVVVWLCEELSLEWSGYNAQSQYELHVDDNFADIYSRQRCSGNFGSCMAGNGQYYFYMNSVKAKAAYLTDEDGKIVARAVIFTDVTDETTGKKLRLCERQYASDGDDMLKQILVNKLIAGGYIDGYKRVGADCHSPRTFVDVNGNDMSGRDLHIYCDLDEDGILSYQDTFKWYDMGRRTAYNYEADGADYDLSTTDNALNPRNWDSWHEQYTNSELERVYYRGEVYYCAEDWLDDFVWVESEGEYHYYDETFRCAHCGEGALDSDCWHSEVTGEDYCCEDCMRGAEREYCENHPDEYVWMDGEAVPADEVGWCDECGEPGYADDMFYSEVTDEHYCCEACQTAAEKAYCERHPDEYRWVDGEAVPVGKLEEALAD